MMLREVTNEDFRDVIKTIAGNDEILKIAEYILQGFVQQQNCKILTLKAPITTATDNIY